MRWPRAAKAWPCAAVASRLGGFTYLYEAPVAGEYSRGAVIAGTYRIQELVGDGTSFIVMESLEGRDLRSVLKEEGDLPIERAVDLTLQVCEALAAAHASQIIVRDIKPENLFVTDAADGEYVKLFDVGPSELDLSEQENTRHETRTTNSGLGTLAYTAPEQIRASNRLDARADQWSLGCVLYELLTGVSPFDRTSPMQTCAAILEDEPQPLREICLGASAELEAALTRCLRKDPSDRFADIAEFALAIAPFGARCIRSAQRSVELLATAERRSRPASLRSDSPLQEIPTERILQRLVDRGESEFMALTEADLMGAEETDSVELFKSRKRRWVLLAFGALTVLSSAYLAARGWDAAHSQSAPEPALHAADRSPDLAAIHANKNVEASTPAEAERDPPPTAAPTRATPEIVLSAPAATNKSSSPTPKRRPLRDSKAEPDVGF
jgi:serine/threonine protein kinase